MSPSRSILIRLRLAGILAWMFYVVAAVSGCSHQEPAPASPEASSSAPSPARATAVTPVEREVWEISSMGNARMGYSRTTVTPLVRNGRPLVRVEQTGRMTVRRFDTTLEMDLHFSCLETPQGQLVEYESVISQGTTRMAAQGHVEGNRLVLTVSSRNKIDTVSKPLPPDCGGFFACQESLWREPMQPGQRRTVHEMEPITHEVSTMELSARAKEPVQLPGKRVELLRIDGTMTLAGQVTQSTLWTDARGEILKTSLQQMNLESVRSTKEEALADSPTASFDLAWNLSIPVKRPLPQPHQTRQVRYRVELDGGDPAKTFVSGPSQTVISTGPHTAEITVYAIRPGDRAGNADAPADPPTEADLRPSQLIQSDDPQIVEAARAVAAGRDTPWQVAVALEKCVQQRIHRKGYTQAFASASEAFQTREGDCTEHAVLLAAMARAQKIPARTAMGLVYFRQTFLYHMWTEVFLDGRWIPIDATLGQGGIGAAHLKLSHTSLEGSTPYASLLPVAQVAGRLKIEILNTEESTK